MHSSESIIKDNLKELWWVPLVFLTYIFNWVFFIYAGYASRNKKLIYYAFIYAVPFILIMWDKGNIGYIVSYFFWIGGFIHAIFLSKEFVVRRLTLKNGGELDCR